MTRTIASLIVAIATALSLSSCTIEIKDPTASEPESTPSAEPSEDEAAEDIEEVEVTPDAPTEEPYSEYEDPNGAPLPVAVKMLQEQTDAWDFSTDEQIGEEFLVVCDRLSSGESVNRIAMGSIVDYPGGEYGSLMAAAGETTCTEHKSKIYAWSNS